MVARDEMGPCWPQLVSLSLHDLGGRSRQCSRSQVKMGTLVL
jgi:hypothetical protein